MYIGAGACHSYGSWYKGEEGGGEQRGERGKDTGEARGWEMLRGERIGKRMMGRRSRGKRGK